MFASLLHQKLHWSNYVDTVNTRKWWNKMCYFNLQVPRLVTSTSTTKLERFPPPHLDASIGYSLDSSVDGATEEFFSSSVVELKKMPSLIFGHVKSYLNSPKKGMHSKARPSLNMAPPTVLIGAFRPYSFGQPMEVRRKNREQFRSKGRNAVGAVKWQPNHVFMLPPFFLPFTFLL